MAIDTDAALSIINDAKSDGYWEDPVPESPDEQVKVATYLYEEAKKAFEAGVRDNAVQKIIFTGDSAMKAQTVEDTLPRRSSGGISESDERETDSVDIAVRENLPIPAPIESEPDPMPVDLSTTTDRDIRRLSGEYNAYHGRVTYLLSVEQAMLISANHLLNAERARATRETPKTKDKLAKTIEAEVAADPAVKEMADKVAEHEKQIAVLKGLKEIYSGNVSVLSREWTMRQNEWEKGR
jgi:hypothetical protein